MGATMRKTHFSLMKKTVLVAVLLSLAVGGLAIAIFYKGIQDVIRSQYKARSLDIANLVAMEIDSEKVLRVQEAVKDIYERTENKVTSDQWGSSAFEEYVSRFSEIEEMEEHREVKSELQRMQNVLGINCLYIIWVDAENRLYLYLVDADYREPCPVGCIDEILPENEATLKNPEIGFAPNITNMPEYGYLITTAMPIFADQGKVVAYAAVDISMNTVMAQAHRFLAYAALAFLFLTVLVCFLIILLVNRMVVRPVNQLSKAAAEYTRDRKSFLTLNIHRNDEIGILADSMVHMESDMNGYIESLERATDALTTAREHAEHLDRVAKVDPLTKALNKRAFALERHRLEESEEPYSIVMIDMNNLKAVNDTYGHDKGDVSIKTLFAVIRRTFRHSHVYRVGGDEFIALLEHDDYLERETLLVSLNSVFQKNQESTALPPWRRVTAAVGYADFVPGSGETVDALLKRADMAMYERKKAMKAVSRL